MTTDSSMKTEKGLSLNNVTKPAPGDVPNLCGILNRSRCYEFYAVYDIKKFFRSVRTLDRDCYLRIVCVPASSFAAPPSSPPSWMFYRDCAIPFGDSSSGVYAACVKTADVHAYLHEAPTDLQETICQALIADTYVDDGVVGTDSKEMLSNLQDEISKLLKKGGFQVKSWECSGQEGISKYLGMNWNRKEECYLLKFRLNLHKKTRGIPSGEDLDSRVL